MILFGTFFNLIVRWVGAGVMNDSRTSVDTFHCIGYVLSREYFLTHSVHISIGQQRWGHVASLLEIGQTSIQKGKILRIVQGVGLSWRSDLSKILYYQQK